MINLTINIDGSGIYPITGFNTGDFITIYQTGQFQPSGNYVPLDSNNFIPQVYFPSAGIID